MRHDTFLGRLGTIGTLSLGYQVLYVIGIIIVSTVVAGESTFDPEKMPWELVFVDEMPVLSRTNPTGTDRTFRSLDGQPVTVREKQVVEMGVGLFASKNLVDVKPSAWSKVRLSDHRNYTEPWFFIQEQTGDVATGYFIAYSSTTRLPAFYLGAKGQSNSIPSTEQRFQLIPGMLSVITEEGTVLSTYIDSENAISTNGRVLVLTTTGLQYIDLKSRTVANVVSSSNLFSIGVSAQRELTFGYLGQRSSSDDNLMLLRSQDTVFQIKHKKVTTSYIIPETLRMSYFTAYPVDDGTMYYAYSAKALNSIYFVSSDFRSPDNLLKCDKAGRVLQQWVLEQPASPNRFPTNVDFLSIAGAFPMPLSIVGTLAANNLELGIDRAELVRRVWPSYLVMFCCGILSVIAAWKLAPRFSGAPVEWGWMVYVFLFGLPGLVGYLMHFRRRRRPLLAPAPKLGTEVFA